MLAPAEGLAFERPAMPAVAEGVLLGHNSRISRQYLLHVLCISLSGKGIHINAAAYEVLCMMKRSLALGLRYVSGLPALAQARAHALSSHDACARAEEVSYVPVLVE